MSIESYLVVALLLVDWGILRSICLIDSKIAWFCSRLGVGGLFELRADPLACNLESFLCLFYFVEALTALLFCYFVGRLMKNLLAVPWPVSCENLMFIFFGSSELGYSILIVFLGLRKLPNEPTFAVLPSCAQDWLKGANFGLNAKNLFLSPADWKSLCVGDSLGSSPSWRRGLMWSTVSGDVGYVKIFICFAAPPDSPSLFCSLSVGLSSSAEVFCTPSS